MALFDDMTHKMCADPGCQRTICKDATHCRVHAPRKRYTYKFEGPSRNYINVYLEGELQRMIVAIPGTREYRSATEMTYLKCWCGNIAGLNETYCRTHRNSEDCPMSKKDADANFCVVAATAGRTASDWPRNWYTTQELAEEHGKEILRRDYRNNNQPRQVFVVEVKKVLEIGIPDVRVLDPNEYQG